MSVARMRKMGEREYALWESSALGARPTNSSCVQASGGPQRHRRTAKRQADTNSPRVT